MSIPAQSIIDKFASMTLANKIKWVLDAIGVNNYSGQAYYPNGMVFSHNNINVSIEAAGVLNANTKFTFTVQQFNGNYTKSTTDWNECKNACTSLGLLVTTTGGGNNWTVGTVTVILSFSANGSWTTVFGVAYQPSDSTYQSKHASFCNTFGDNITSKSSLY